MSPDIISGDTVYDLTNFLILGQKSVKFFGGFLENLKFQKGHSDIN